MFKNIKEANKYNAFDKNLLDIAYCLRLESVINFTALSTHFNKVINDRKSIFLKKWAVKTKNMKYFKSKACDSDHYKLKLVAKRVSDIKKKIAKFPSPSWQKELLCRKCNKYALPDNFWVRYHRDYYNQFCNCKMVDCISKRELIMQEIHDRKQSEKFKKNNLEEKKNALLRQLKKIDEKMEKVDEKIEKLDQQEKEFKTVPSYKSMVPLIKNLKENGHYKNTRKQAEKLFNEVTKLVSENSNERINVNYNEIQAVWEWYDDNRNVWCRIDCKSVEELEVAFTNWPDDNIIIAPWNPRLPEHENWFYRCEVDFNTMTLRNLNSGKYYQINRRLR